MQVVMSMTFMYEMELIDSFQSILGGLIFSFCMTMVLSCWKIMSPISENLKKLLKNIINDNKSSGINSSKFTVNGFEVTDSKHVDDSCHEYFVHPGHGLGASTPSCERLRVLHGKG